MLKKQNGWRGEAWSERLTSIETICICGRHINRVRETQEDTILQGVGVNEWQGRAGGSLKSPKTRWLETVLEVGEIF